MKYAIPVLALTFAVLLTTVYQQGQTAEEKPQAKEEPLLLLDDDPPLLLDDDPPRLLDDDPPLLLDDGDGEPSAKGAKMADNSRCHVCHLNFEVEDIAVGHAKENIACTKCHGDCDEHIADEELTFTVTGFESLD